MPRAKSPRALAKAVLPYAAFVTLASYAAKERLSLSRKDEPVVASRAPREPALARPPSADDEDAGAIVAAPDATPAR